MGKHKRSQVNILVYLIFRVEGPFTGILLDDCALIPAEVRIRGNLALETILVNQLVGPDFLVSIFDFLEILLLALNSFLSFTFFLVFFPLKYFNNSSEFDQVLLFHIKETVFKCGFHGNWTLGMDKIFFEVGVWILDANIFLYMRLCLLNCLIHPNLPLLIHPDHGDGHAN